VPAAAALLASAVVAATPIPQPAYLPPTDQATGTETTRVQTFSPVARAEVLARQIPRRWVGTYQSFGSGAPQPVELQLSSLTPIGQIVTLRGEISIAGVKSPVQGTLSAESDQLYLLVLGDRIGAGLQPGGLFQGLQGLEISGWNALRLTDMGGRLALKPVRSAR
jgi:hypothetical protein